MADPDATSGAVRSSAKPTSARSAPDLGGPDDLDDADDGVSASGPAVDAPAPAAAPKVVDVRIARPMPTWARAYAGAGGVAAGVIGALAVFRTDNGVGSAALLLVAVFLVITAVDGQFPRLKIGDNEVMSNLTRAYHQAEGKAQRATAEAADAQVSSDDVRDGLNDVQARLGRLELLVGPPGPTAAAQDGGEPASRSPHVTPADNGTRTPVPPAPGSDVAFGIDLDGPPRAGRDHHPTAWHQLEDLGERYKSTRWTMPRGPARTRVMSDLVDDIRHVVRAADALDVDSLLGSDDIGHRLVAAVALYEHPDPAAVPALAEQALSDRKPFNEFWSLRALRRCLSGRCDLLTEDLRGRLDRRAAVVSHDASRATLIRQILRDCP